MPPLLDALLALVLTVLTLVTLADAGEGPVSGTAVVLAVLSVAPLAVRQQAPVPSMLVIVAALAGFALLGYGDFPSSGLGMVVALFTVATLRPRRVAAGMYPLTVVVVMLGATGGVVWSQVAQAALTLLGAWMLGEGTRRWTERVRRAAVDAERAVTAERTRIAQELHDVVSHHMSVAALQSGVAEFVLDSDPDSARRAVVDAGAASRDALLEMRRMLDALRTQATEAAPYAPQPGLAEVDTLLDRVRAAGLEVELEHLGDGRPLPPGLDLCAYRVVQESLTNVLRHAGPARARVQIDRGERVLTVRVDDDGTGVTVPSTPAGGRGVAGMRERAELYGGTLEAGPLPGGGYAVVLRLPVPPEMSP